MVQRRESIVPRLSALALLTLLAAGGTYFHLGIPLEDGGSYLMLRYFTVQSTILVSALAIAEFVLVVMGREPGRRFSVLRGGVLLAILVTGLVFALFLSAAWKPTGYVGLANRLSHTYVPILSALYWLVFAKRGALRWSDAPLWLVFPLAYLAWSMGYGAFTGFYPYWFLNPELAYPAGMGSYLGVAAFSVMGLFAFLGVALGLVAVDRFLARGIVLSRKAQAEELRA